MFRIASGGSKIESAHQRLRPASKYISPPAKQEGTADENNVKNVKKQALTAPKDVLWKSQSCNKNSCSASLRYTLKKSNRKTE